MGDSYDVKELEDALKRAFVDNESGTIFIDGQTMRNEFLRQSLSHGLDNGLLTQDQTFDEDRRLGYGLGQSYACTYRLSDKGRKYFDIIAKV